MDAMALAASDEACDVLDSDEEDGALFAGGAGLLACW